MRRSREPRLLSALVEAKVRHGHTVSVCLPARDEEATVGRVVGTVRRALMERLPLVDEVVVIDDGSTDATADIARAEGAHVLTADEVLPHLPPGSGKGNALWKSLYVSQGDLLCWIDADIRNFRAHFVTRLLAPLLNDPAIGMVKGYYRRPLHGEPSGGGRVTELMARPVLSYLFPMLTRFVQPLSGEYAARRSLVETVPFVEGWGVEIGLLLDVVFRFGVQSVTQVDLGVREHRNRPLEELGPQALAILATVLRRAGIDACDPPFVSELVRYDDQLAPVRVPVVVSERPPMITVPEYCAKFGREQTA
ncbi:MAG TPA: glucosyl-3-phosphoglycerate synthase [Acidimicrobiia bacterium]|nr:glucosyl-3-phosphoglycerate synthase [Acidimicrobiia bacterium]